MTDKPKEKTLRGMATGGTEGRPGQAYSICRAEVYELPSGRCELRTCRERGSNRGGHLEPHWDASRSYRADTLDELLRIGLAETAGDEVMASPELAQAIRDACFEAEDGGEDGP